jgi:intracellular sulfur oxidation DsrE/DsrF family protein
MSVAARIARIPSWSPSTHSPDLEVPMSRTTSLSRALRAFAAIGLVATALVAGMAMSKPIGSLRSEASLSAQAPWLGALKGRHRQLFDSPAPDGGIPLVHVLNFYDTYNKAFKVADRDINGVLTFYGKTTFHGLSDGMWAKYELGEFLGEKDATGKGAIANPWRANPTIIGMQMPSASIESLQKRGASFIICNNALSIFSGMVAQARGLEPAKVYEDMKANILPGVTLVPAMVIAIEQAQNAGLTYHRQ